MTIEIGLTLSIILITFALFIWEKWPTDVNAVIALSLLGLFSQLPGITPLIQADQLFVGFSSNAVVAIIALMIMAAGVQNTGAMNYIGRLIVTKSGGKHWKTLSLLCACAGFTSAFMQNIGAVALFIPVASYISFQAKIPLKNLLLPMAFCVILGGNLSLLGNGSLLILNDLITSSPLNLKEIELFDVFPVGIALLTCGIIIFLLTPKSVYGSPAQESPDNDFENLLTQYNLEEKAFEVPTNSVVVGHTVRWFEEQYQLQIVALKSASRRETLAPYRSSIIENGAIIGVTGKQQMITACAEKLVVEITNIEYFFADLLQRQSAGYSEIVISSRSKLIDNSLHNSFFRKVFDATPIVLSRKDNLITESDVNYTLLQAGDMILVHSPRNSIDRVQDKKEIISVMSECPNQEINTDQSLPAFAIFILSLSLTVITPLPIGLCLWLGVLSMFLTNIIRPHQGYSSVSWKTAVMLASLIPLGIAVESTGTAAWLANLIVTGLPGNHLIVQICLAVLATFLSLVMSNVGATVILVPVALNIASAIGIEPLLLVLLVGISTSNSFLIPTHQVNAIILAAGKYHVTDFVRAGGLITLVYILIEIVILNLMFYTL